MAVPRDRQSKYFLPPEQNNRVLFLTSDQNAMSPCLFYFFSLSVDFWPPEEFHPYQPCRPPRVGGYFLYQHSAAI